MPDLDADKLARAMLAAARAALKKQWPAAKAYAEMEFRKLAQTLVMIEAQHALGELSKTEAKLLLEIQRNAARSVLLTLEGMGVIAAERAINAALRIVRDTVNAAVGFALL